MLGFINIYKPSGMTSNAVVQKIKKKFGIKKIGHMGTLDPMACGILPLAVGKATRLFDYMLSKTKKYVAEFEFGYETDTLDSTGEVVNQTYNVPTLSDVKNQVSLMIGKMNQMPPKYSAKCVDGRRAYDLAREGIDFELKPKEIEILDMHIISNTANKYKIAITCSSGTYIRAIGRDLAYKLNSYATMTYLERTESARFNVSNSITLDDALRIDNIDNFLITPFEVFENYDTINIDNTQYKNLLDGKTIPCEHLNNNAFLVYDEKLIGVCKANKDYLKLDTYLEE